MEKIVAKDKWHLFELIGIEMEKNGFSCDLNHIDVSEVEDLGKLFSNREFNRDISKWNGDISKWNVGNVYNMQGMFADSQFNGDISGWDVSKVKYMSEMFKNSQFDGDISGWDVSHVEYMGDMFSGGKFNGDISKWNVSRVKNMSYMFFGSKFNHDLSAWNNMGLAKVRNMFKDCLASVPWWYTDIENKKERMKEIKRRREVMNLNKKLVHNLIVDKNNIKGKKIKL